MKAHDRKNMKTDEMLALSLSKPSAILLAIASCAQAKSPHRARSATTRPGLVVDNIGTSIP